ncbi:MAG: aminopeptidase, partial [Oscillospiraceae bacterium]
MSETKDVRKDLFYEQKNGYDRIGTEERVALEDYCEGYKAYLDASRTEREAVAEGIRLAEEKGFVPFVPGMEVKPGMKLYRSNRGKSLLLAVVGRKPLSQGCNVAAAHVDAPRLDLKPCPLYEDGELAYFKTHYYGGIKKYQWVTIP